MRDACTKARNGMATGRELEAFLAKMRKEQSVRTRVLQYCIVNGHEPRPGTIGDSKRRKLRASYNLRKQNDECTKSKETYALKTLTWKHRCTIVAVGVVLNRVAPYFFVDFRACRSPLGPRVRSSWLHTSNVIRHTTYSSYVVYFGFPFTSERLLL